jgi:hypothetical protein
MELPPLDDLFHDFRKFNKWCSFGSHVFLT